MHREKEVEQVAAREQVPHISYHMKPQPMDIKSQSAQLIKVIQT